MDWDQQYRDGQGRFWPAEELTRFLGRTYGSMIHRKGTGQIAIEIGSGVGGNVWALTQWGFFGVGLELSREAIRQGNEHAKRQGFEHMKEYHHYTAPNTVYLPAKSAQLVIDIQTIQHLSNDDHQAMYREAYRLLAQGGVIFSVHWCGGQAAKDIFPGHPELCEWSRYHSFVLNEWVQEAGFRPARMHIMSRTYPGVIEPAEWAVLEAVKA